MSAPFGGRSILEAHLLDYINNNMLGEEGGRSMLVYGNGISEGTMVSDKGINPDGKVLGPSELRAANAILAKHREAQRLLVQRERVLRGEALLAAVGMGQYVMSEPRPPITSSSDRSAMVEQARQQGTKQREFVAKTQEMLSARLGVLMRDWACSQLSTNLPDGTGYSTVVYFTPQHAPELFACRKALMDDIQAERQELKQYFLSIPK